MKKLLVYYLDKDAKEFCNFRDRNEAHNDIEIRCYVTLTQLQKDLRDESLVRPDLILLDMFSKNTEKEKQLEEKSKGSYEKKLKLVEKRLAFFSKFRSKLYDMCLEVWWPEGYSNANALVDEFGEELDIPIAISSRYGRRLFPSPKFNELQAKRVGWVWKCKDAPTKKGEFDIDDASYELQSMENVIRSHQVMNNYKKKVEFLESTLKAKEEELISSKEQYYKNYEDKDNELNSIVLDFDDQIKQHLERNKKIRRWSTYKSIFIITVAGLYLAEPIANKLFGDVLSIDLELLSIGVGITSVLLTLYTYIENKRL